MSRVIVLLVFTALGWAQTPRRSVWSLPPELAGIDWTPLFNGKDLAGWVKVGNEKWEVEGGAIHGQGISKEYGYLRTEKKFKDFHLNLRFKCERDGNSGVFFRTEFENNRPVHGLQFEIDRKPNYKTGGIYGDGRGFIVWPAAEHEMALRPDDWNDYLMKVEGNRYVSVLNGFLMVDFTDPNPKSFDGHIALQLHSGGEGNMWFKDIFIRNLFKR